MPKKIKIYAECVEPTALQQFNSAMAQDFAVQGALMPDVHTGYSLPIGAVVATEGVVLPSWVGYDIGCGMCALPLDIDGERIRQQAKAIFTGLYQAIPVGFLVNHQPCAGATGLDPKDLSKAGRAIAEGEHRQQRSWLHALGSLGGGNHFIELGADETGLVWAIIHSGSRGIGHGLATHYMKLASGVGKAREGHYGLRVDSAAGQDYINDMNWALQFALDNRMEMMRRIIEVVNRVTGSALRPDLDRLINRNHNHALQQGRLWIHRKGATHAEAGMLGVIPGNMRDGSFIVRGKGNPESLNSSSHGAGRVLGRKEAMRKLNLNDFRHAMTGVVARIEGATLDESPFAYKDVFAVMRQQADLVETLHHVRPLINIKG